jgi:hypothetical protein
VTDSDNGKVGYGRPPEATRFKPGQSGNPRGRPVASLSLKSILRKLLKKKAGLPNGKKIPLLEAVLMAQAAKAAKGDTKAAQLLMALFASIDDAKQQDDLQLTAEEQAILARSLKRLGKEEASQ